MRQLLLKEFTKLNPSEMTLFRSSELYRLLNRCYLNSDYETQFSTSYFKDLNIQPWDRVVYLDSEPVLYLRAHLENGILSTWKRPIEPICHPHLSPKEKAQIFGGLKNALLQAKIDSLEVYHDDVLTSILWDSVIQSTPSFHATIDLSQSEEEIFSTIRKSYKSLCNWGEKNLETKYFDRNNYKDGLIDQFKRFHIEVSGRQTRSDETWTVQENLVKSGAAFITMSYLQGKLVSAVLTLHGSEEAFYGVAVNDRILMAEGLAVGHWPLFSSILQSKKMGMKFFNMGAVWSINMNDKELNIGKFKKGFCSTLCCKVIHKVQFKKGQSN